MIWLFHFLCSWLRGVDDTQKTDVHYRTLNGNGHFNWRFVFPLEYLPAENVMIIKRKEHFYSLTETEHNILPIFTVQVWDNDIFTPDDFIGKCVLKSLFSQWIERKKLLYM